MEILQEFKCVWRGVCRRPNAVYVTSKLHWILTTTLWGEFCPPHSVNDRTGGINTIGILMIWELQKVSRCGSNPDRISSHLLITASLEIWWKLVVTLAIRRLYPLLKILHTVSEVSETHDSLQLQVKNSRRPGKAMMNPKRWIIKWGNFRQQPSSGQRMKYY